MFPSSNFAALNASSILGSRSFTLVVDSAIVGGFEIVACVVPKPVEPPGLPKVVRFEPKGDGLVALAPNADEFVDG